MAQNSLTSAEAANWMNSKFSLLSHTPLTDPLMYSNVENAEPCIEESAVAATKGSKRHVESVDKDGTNVNILKRQKIPDLVSAIPGTSSCELSGVNESTSNTLTQPEALNPQACSNLSWKESESLQNINFAYGHNQSLSGGNQYGIPSISSGIAMNATIKQDYSAVTNRTTASFCSSANTSAAESAIHESTGKPNAKSFRFFIGGIPQDIEEEEIKAYFMYYGDVKEVRIAKDYFTGFGRGFAFVTMSDETSKARIFQDSHELRGKRIDVREENNTVPTDINRKIFVGGLDPSWNEACLSSYFSRFGPVETVHIVTDGNGKSRCFAFITFGDESVAQKVVQHGTHNIMERCIEVRKAEPKKSRNNYRNTIAAYQNWYNTAQWYNPNMQGTSLYACTDTNWGAPYAAQAAAAVPTADAAAVSLPPSVGTFYDISSSGETDAASNWYMNSVACAAYANQFYASQQAAAAQYMNYYYQGLYGQNLPQSFGLQVPQGSHNVDAYNGMSPEIEDTSSPGDEKGNFNDSTSTFTEFQGDSEQPESTSASSESLNPQASTESHNTQCDEKSVKELQTTENSSNLLEASSTETLVA